MPVCRFLIQSLPLESLAEKSCSPPRAIDYACGAGHFLNELALQLKPVIESHLADSGLESHEIEQRLADQRSEIYGIEKEYRLSKISKVSAFMYQQPEIKLAYGDALVRDIAGYPEIKNGSFDILVANPPYSVKGFLETLPDEERARYSLSDTVNDPASANSIETFFIERAVQLLAPGGVAAIILPASIISNGGGTYTRAREILLQSFDIIAIAEFGSGTFGKTGTNTTTLFLRRKQTQPSPAEHYRDRIEEWFKGGNADKAKTKAYKDAHLIDDYARHCEIEPEEYKTLFASDPSAALLTHNIFATYTADFENLTTTKALKKQGKFKTLAKPKQEAELRRRLIIFITAIERDKLLHYLLAHDQETPVLILKSPTDTKERKKFLGYDWSSAKGDEGIKLVTDKDNNHITPLYDPTDRTNPEKISNAIARNFQGKLKEIPESLSNHIALHRLENFLDFSRTSFEKQISLTPKKTVEIKSKWPVMQLREIAGYSTERTEAAGLTEETYVGVESLLQNFAGKVNSGFVPETGKVTAYREGDILMSNIRPYLKKIWFANQSGGASNDVLVLRVNDKDFESPYVYNYLAQAAFIDFVMEGKKGVKMPRGDKNHILSYQIPKPPPQTQQDFVNSCAEVDARVQKAKTLAESARGKIKAAVSEVISTNTRPLKVKSLIKKVSGAQTKIPQEAIVSNGEIPVITQQADSLISGYCDGFDPIYDIPLVVFGDHTCVFKFVDFEFVRGADGTQLLKFDKLKIDAKYASIWLSYSEITNSGKYERHFKYVKEMTIPVVPPAEQKKLVAKIELQEAIIAEAEAVIAAAPAKKAAILKKHLE